MDNCRYCGYPRRKDTSPQEKRWLCGSIATRSVFTQSERCAWIQKDRGYDPVNHPSHYQGAVECIEAIEAAGIGPEYCRGNAMKYLWRLGKKGDPLEDAKKAQWYVNRLVEQMGADEDE